MADHDALSGTRGDAFDDALLPGDPRDDILADPFTPGSFQALMELLEELDHDSPREPFAGMAFFVSPEEYLTLLQMELPRDVGPSDYSCGIVYFKSKTSLIHRCIVLFFTGTLNRQVTELWTENATIKQLGGPPLLFSTEVRDNDNLPTVDLTPDVAIIFADGDDAADRSPPLVVEVIYAHKFSYKQAEERYQQYFRAKDSGVKVVICVRLHYASGLDRAKKTAENLERSSISVWMMDQHGAIQTTMR